MMRDYTDFMNMTPNDLAQYARENANGSDLIQALADLLDAVVQECNTLEDRNSELADAERRVEGWREETMAVQRQLDQVRG